MMAFPFRQVLSLSTMVDKCPCGLDRSLWGNSLSKERLGWIRTDCTRCGRFIGWCPDAVFYQGQKSEKQEHYT